MHEYTAMFRLTEQDLSRQILDCGGGPASFNAEATAMGCSVISTDPLYEFSGEEIRRRVTETFDVILDGVRQNYGSFLWGQTIASPEALGATRMEAMELFLQDYEGGVAAGRYLPHALPLLPLPDDAFDLSLVSHFLFLYSAENDTEFHFRSICELLRVASEVRVFPLLDMQHARSRHLQPVLSELKSRGFSAHVEPVPYEFQRGANEMLVVHR